MAEGHYRYKCMPAFKIVQTLGGVRKVAGYLDLSPEAVSRWCRPVEKGGHGGFIDLQYWDPLLAWAQERGLRPPVTRTLFYTGMRRRIPLARAQKIKGDRFEYQVVNDLKAAGFDAYRVPLSGGGVSKHSQRADHIGDVRVPLPAPVNLPSNRKEWVLQCKISGSKRSNIGAVGISRMLSAVCVGSVLTLQGNYVAMRQEIMVDLMRGKRPPIVNYPVVAARGAQISVAIHAHDALLFRQSGIREWYALVREKQWLAITGDAS